MWHGSNIIFLNVISTLQSFGQSITPLQMSYRMQFPRFLQLYRWDQVSRRKPAKNLQTKCCAPFDTAVILNKWGDVQRKERGGCFWNWPPVHAVSLELLGQPSPLIFSGEISTRIDIVANHFHGPLTLDLNGIVHGLRSLYLLPVSNILLA